MGESARLWEMLQRSYEGNVWHGPALRQLVQSVTAEQASARPVPGAHSIWEYVLHVTTYEDVVRRRLGGEPVGELPREQGWPAVADTSHDAWAATRQHFEQCHNRLREALWGFPDERLNDTVPGRDYPFYLMLYGIIQHDLYHAGQIVLLMEAQGLKPLG